MRLRTGSRVDDPNDETPDRVSSRLLSELWQTLARHGIPPTELLGDLPISVDEHGRVEAPVPWDHFNLFLRRLERRVGGPDGLERCGEWLGRRRRPHAFTGLVALATSPLSLYRAAATWAAPRAMPGVVVELTPVSANHLTLDVRVPEALGPCAPILHVTAGIYRTLPGLLGMPDAVVESRIEPRRARYDITVPSSRTLLARLRRLLRSMLTPGTALRQLEDRQLELSARLTRLSRAHATLAESESRLRALSDASVDVLCELDEGGRIVFASASIHDLTGYAPDQVAGSHYRLWIPSSRRARVDARFEALRAAPVGTSVARRRIELHAAHGRRVKAEASFRSYLGPDGAWRAVASLRAATGPSAPSSQASRPTSAARSPRPSGTRPSAPLARPASPWLEPVAGRRPTPLRDASLARRVDEAATEGCHERLRRGLVRLREQYAGHPLERSLPELVSLLETFEHEAVPYRAERLVDSTRRMTRIVEHVLLGERGASAAAQWLETQKLVDRLREGWRRRLEANEIELSLDVSRAPAELYGSEPLLEACVTGLLEWAIERSPARRGLAGTGRVELALTKLSSDPTATGTTTATAIGGVRIMVFAAVSQPGRDRIGSDERQRADSELALALAADAAHALGGTLESLSLHEGDARAIRLPQPEPGTMPAQEIGTAPITTEEVRQPTRAPRR